MMLGNNIVEPVSASHRDIPAQLLIAGQLRAGQGEELHIVNPATQEDVVSLKAASLTQVDEAVGSAKAAFYSGVWDDPALRRRVLAKFADLIERDADILMDLLISEIGTPVALKVNQINIPVEFMRWYSEMASLDRGRDLGVNRAGTARSQVALRPVGVVAAITAYNYPIQIAIAKVGAALAAGCTAVLLSSPQAPLAVLRFGMLAREAGIPDGVLNVIAGGADVGKALSEHSDVDKVTFTGSVNVGRHVMLQAAQGLKGVVLELGGKSAAIMLPGVDYSRYVKALHMRYARHAGQGCGSPTRILVEEARLEEFIQLSKEVYKNIVVGDPRNPETIVGPLISEAHRARVEGVIDDAVSRGARIAAGGGRPSDARRGWFLNPTLLTNLDNSWPIARDEIFGPVSVVLTYRTIGDAIAIANDSELGLKAYLFGQAEECEKLASKLRVGTVVINGGGGLRPDAPMCGYKKSGVGREWGEEGILEFMETQHIDRGLA